jgi:hypothetical protein
MPATAACVGDCNGNEEVTADELITMVNIALGNAELSTCPVDDVDGNGEITIDQILQAVNNALSGCTPSPPPVHRRPDACWHGRSEAGIRCRPASLGKRSVVMWLIIFLVAMVIMVAVARRAVDSETRKNLGFYGKVAAALFAALMFVGLLLSNR